MCAEAGEDIGQLTPIVPRIQAVLAAARRSLLQVIHTREGFAPDLSDLPAPRRERNSVGRCGPLGRFLIRGEPGHDFIEDLRPEAGEMVVDKPGYGAFHRTTLEADLRDLGITHLILSGVTTQCCVQSTLREAVDRGFTCLLLADCCAALDPALHAATLVTIQGENHLFGWIAESGALLAALERTGSG
jgi:nicotinamidase-related amidase